MAYNSQTKSFTSEDWVQGQIITEDKLDELDKKALYGGNSILIQSTKPTGELAESNKIWINNEPEALMSAEVVTSDDLENIIAPLYDSTSAYAVGDYVITNDNNEIKLWRCKVATNGENWEANHWVQVAVGEGLKNFITVSNTQPTNGLNKIWIKPEDNIEYQVPTYEEFTNLQSAFDYSSSFTNSGEYTLPASAFEQGSWSYSTKSVNAKRIRCKFLVPVKSGTMITYTNPTLDIYIGRLATATGTGYAQNSGWVNPQEEGATFTANNDGYLAIILRGHNNEDIMPSNYDCTVVITASNPDDVTVLKTLKVGASNTIGNNQSAAVGYNNTIGNYYGFATGRDNTASGESSSATGYGTTASATGAHSEGRLSEASGSYSHAEGESTVASGLRGHAEGYLTEASGMCAHAEGSRAVASGVAAHAEGIGTIAASEGQSASGKYNVEDADGVYAEIVGGGISTSRKNIRTLDWDGNEEITGGLRISQFTVPSVKTDVYRVTKTSPKKTIWSDGYYTRTNSWHIDEGAVGLWVASQAFPVTSKKIAVTRTSIVSYAYLHLYHNNGLSSSNQVNLSTYGISVTGTPASGDTIIVGKRKPTRTDHNVPASSYVYFAESDNNNLTVTLNATSQLTENQYQFVYTTVNGETGWYDQYAALSFLGVIYAPVANNLYSGRLYFELENNVDYIRIHSRYQITEGGSTVNLCKLATVEELSTDFALNWVKDRRKAPSPMITFIDDDTTSKTYVQRFHDIFDASNYSNVPTGYHLAGCYAVEAYKLIENPVLTRMSLTATNSTAVLGDVEESYTPPYDASEQGPALLNRLKEYEEDGFEMIYHCMYQRGRANVAHNTAYLIDRFERNADNLWLVRHNIATGLRVFDENGLSRWRRHWVTPYGCKDAYIQGIAKQLGFESLIATHAGMIADGVYVDRYALPRFPYDYGYSDGHGTAEAIINHVDDAVDTNAWIIIMSHVNDWGSSVQQYTNGFRQIIQHCIDTGCEIVSYSDGYERHKAAIYASEK